MSDGYCEPDNLSGEKNWPVSAETRVAGAYTDHITSETQGEETLGRRLDDLIATLPEIRRRKLEEHVSALMGEEIARLPNGKGD